VYFCQGQSKTPIRVGSGTLNPASVVPAKSSADIAMYTFRPNELWQVHKDGTKRRHERTEPVIGELIVLCKDEIATRSQTDGDDAPRQRPESEDGDDTPRQRPDYNKRPDEGDARTPARGPPCATSLVSEMPGSSPSSDDQADLVSWLIAAMEGGRGMSALYCPLIHAVLGNRCYEKAQREWAKVFGDRWGTTRDSYRNVVSSMDESDKKSFASDGYFAPNVQERLLGIDDDAPSALQAVYNNPMANMLRMHGNDA
jgi:hypothetical protein